MSTPNPCDECRYEALKRREQELELPSNDADFLLPEYARFMKLAAGRIKWKLENHKKAKDKCPILAPQDIKNLHIMLGKINQYMQQVPVDLRKNSPINESFFKSKEGDALDYFDKNLSKRAFYDTFGEKIFIHEDSYAFMYKNDDGKHVVESQNYVQERGERLSYIPFVIRASKCILERPYRFDKTGATIDRMYLHAFAESSSSRPRNKIVYMAVIVLRDRKGNKTTFFKTAFPVVGEMDLYRRLSGGYSFVENQK